MRVSELWPYVKRDKFCLATVCPHAKLKVALRGADCHDNSLGTVPFISLIRLTYTYIVFPSLELLLSPLSQEIFANTAGKLSRGWKKRSANSKSALARSFVSFSVNQPKVPRPKRIGQASSSTISARHLADLISLPSCTRTF